MSLKKISGEDIFGIILTTVVCVLIVGLGCQTRPKQLSCEDLVLDMKAATACARDPNCQKTFDFYRDGFKKLDYMSKNCPF